MTKGQYEEALEVTKISADSCQLRPVFENLLTNAFNHNPMGIWLSLDAQVKKGRIYCTVADNGVGMSQELCDRLFQLYCVTQDTKDSPQGHRLYTGLGFIN